MNLSLAVGHSREQHPRHLLQAVRQGGAPRASCRCHCNSAQAQRTLSSNSTSQGDQRFRGGLSGEHLEGARRAGWHRLCPLPPAPGPTKAPDSSQVHAQLREQKTPPFCKGSSAPGALLRCRADGSRCTTRSPRGRAAKPLPAASHMKSRGNGKSCWRGFGEKLGLPGRGIQLRPV